MKRRPNGLKINSNKTKYVIMSVREETKEKELRVFLNSQEEYIYLDVVFNEEGKKRHELDAKMTKGI